MVYCQGNWFHSRVASSRTERASIVRLVEASVRHSGLRWTSSTDPRSTRFAQEISVQISQMRTKINAFMRYGFIKKGYTCPLQWTKMGEIWRSLVINAGQNLQQYTDIIGELIIASSLALYSFNDTGFTYDPLNDYRPVRELFLKLNNQGFISTADIQTLIGETNRSYWVTDLKNAGILGEIATGFQLTNKFPHLFNAIRTVTLPTTLTENDWKRIQNDVLDPQNPYIESILKEMEDITNKIFTVEPTLPLTQQDIVKKMIDYTDEKEATEIEEKDYKIEDTYSRVKTRRKQSAWSNKVREDYNHKCCIPMCDVESDDFLVAAHIKKYSEVEEGNGHRANPRNGLSLCPLCHAMFDKGYFTLTDDLIVNISPKIADIASSRLKDVIVSSDGQRIRRPQRFLPAEEFIRYHRENIFTS